MSRNTAELSHPIERCLLGDEEAWVELVWRFDQRVSQWVARLNYALGEQDIADLRMVVFGKLQQTLPTFQPGKSFLGWLYQA